MGANTPVWLTPEVVKGGFATGNLQAGGPVKPWENEIMMSVAAAQSDQQGIVREVLNQYFLNDGMQVLMDILQSGKYKINVPEEAALLKVAYFLKNGENGKAN